MWKTGWRDANWSRLDQHWDLIVIGGGITGAGILREAARLGLRALLLEAHDFAAGTSSRSSKMVHGGLRYLKNMQFRLTFESVRERERLLREGRGLVNPLGFLLVNYHTDSIPAAVFAVGLAFYDLLALKRGHRHYDAIDLQDLCPPLKPTGLLGGFRYFDAQTDDARLVLRLIQEAVQDGAAAFNYTPAIDLLTTRTGEVCGVVVQDAAPEGCGRTLEIQASAVINATGAWSDLFRLRLGAPERLRKLRGSHLIFPANRLPLTRSVSFLHPTDQRPVFAFPWEGVVIIGTTDVDLIGPLEVNPQISPSEFEYLLLAAQYAFECQELTPQDVLAVFSGVRPVIDTGKSDPSKESREHVLWLEKNLLTVAGGKLTTFRLMALDALDCLRTRLPHRFVVKRSLRVLDPVPLELPGAESLRPIQRLRLAGRYGLHALELLSSAAPGELEPISESVSLWTELRWAARAEGVVHLDDLLLRRVRLGLTLPHGGVDILPRIREVVQSELGWDDARWVVEATHYVDLWKKCYHHVQ